MVAKSWAFNRPYCSPNGGMVKASHYKEAIQLVHLAYGYASGTTVSCAVIVADGGVTTKTFDEDGEVV